MNRKYAVVDLETTGNSSEKGDKIIQIAIIIIENKRIVEHFNSFINPEQNIPPFITKLTKIDDELLEDKPTFKTVAPKILSLLENACFVAHNVKFDLDFLNDHLISSGYEPFQDPNIDTVEMARVIYPTLDSYQLTDLAGEMGIRHDRPHQADSDAEVTALLFLKMMMKFSKLPRPTLKTLLKLSTKLHSDLELLLEQIMIQAYETFSEKLENVEVINGLALKKLRDTFENNGVVEAAFEFPESIAEKEAMFKKAFQMFNYRLGQFQMIDAVFDSFINKQQTIIEAGTGIGKSIAYLLPAAYLAKQTNSSVIISTHTTLLQQQLLQKDIINLKKMLPFEINICLLKGKNNYISLTKFKESLNEENNNYDIALTKMQLLIWLTETDTGDVDELNLSSGGVLFWDKIKKDNGSFLTSSQWGRYDFYERAKVLAESAHLIITNHAFLINSLLSQEDSYLSSNYIVIDEAHHFVKVTSKQIGSQLNYVAIRFLTGRLETMLRAVSSFSFINDERLKQLHELINNGLPELSYEIDQFFSSVKSYIVSYKVNNVVMFTKNTRNATNLTYAAERLYFNLKEIISLAELLVTTFKQEEGKIKSNDKYKFEQLEYVLIELKQVNKKIAALFLKADVGVVTTFEMSNPELLQSISISSEPLSVEQFLQTHLYKNEKSVVFTSATLTVNNKFDYIIKELGLAQFEPQTIQIESPFNYKENVQLFIPDDIPEITEVSEDDFITAITEAIVSIAEATQGRLLILFTSHVMLQRTYHLVKEADLLSDFILIAQGVTSGSNARLMKNFQKFDKTILFGSNSFWEGIDIPGEDLSGLIIVRLPFTNPIDPVFAAKSQLLTDSGQNPFFKLAIPEAALRFKQGFGRLVRSESDRGIIVIFDRRIMTKSYGQAFLNSIPKITVKSEQLGIITKSIDSFLNNEL